MPFDSAVADWELPITNFGVHWIQCGGELCGVLSVKFNTGATLTAPPSEDGYEAWSVVGPDPFALYS